MADPLKNAFVSIHSSTASASSSSTYKNYSLMMTSSALVISLTSPERVKTGLIGTYSRARRTISLYLYVLMFCLWPQKAPTPLRTFAVDLHAVHYGRSQPSPTRKKALSSAQQLVRNARQSIIEPMLSLCGLSSDSSDEEQLAPDSALEI